MLAAGLGNLVSDVVGLSAADGLERFMRRIGLIRPSDGNGGGGGDAVGGEGGAGRGGKGGSGGGGGGGGAAVVPPMTPAQSASPAARRWRMGGSLAGVSAGCLLGLVPLLYVDVG